MKIAYFDCIAGASGDMLLGSLIDAGLPVDQLRNGLAMLRLPGFAVHIQKLEKNGFSATKLDVQVDDDATARTVPEIIALIESSDLSARIKTQAKAMIRNLGKVEARIHNSPLDQVHLHELGGVDTVVDITGFLLALELLGIERVYASPLPIGRGFVRGAHGRIPLPAPATVELLRGVPVVGIDIDQELVTPTGALLLTTLAQNFGPLPPMRWSSVGYGAGGRDLPIPNLVRVFIGESSAGQGEIMETLVELQTNLDDLQPEIFEHVMTLLFDAGALDVGFSALQMKKNRPGIMITVLSRPEQAESLRKILYNETTTLGVRQQIIQRYSLPREIHTVDTAYGPVRVKSALLPDGRYKFSPEYQDCRKLAENSGAPLRAVYQAALSATEKGIQTT